MSVIISMPDIFFSTVLMKVEINNREIILPDGCDNIVALLQSQGISEKGHAVAVDNKVVPRASWAGFRLAEGMRITIIRAVCGG